MGDVARWRRVRGVALYAIRRALAARRVRARKRISAIDMPAISQRRKYYRRKRRSSGEARRRHCDKMTWHVKNVSRNLTSSLPPAGACRISAKRQQPAPSHTSIHSRASNEARHNRRKGGRHLQSHSPSRYLRIMSSAGGSGDMASNRGPARENGERRGSCNRINRAEREIRGCCARIKFK